MSASRDHDTPSAHDSEPAFSMDGGVISGVVTDVEGVPLVGVRVETAGSGGAELEMLPVLTDGDGRFAVEGLGGGRYDLRFALGTVSARVLAVPVGTDQLSVRLARPQGILVLIRTPPGAEALGMCHIVLERQASDGWRRDHCARTVKSRLLLWSIRPGRYRVTAWASPYLPVRAEQIDVVEGQPAPAVELALVALGGAIGGRVTGDPAAGAPTLISWRHLDGQELVPLHVTTQEVQPDGTFSLRGLQPGRHRVTALAADGRLGSEVVDVPDGGYASVDVRVS